MQLQVLSLFIYLVFFLYINLFIYLFVCLFICLFFYYLFLFWNFSVSTVNIHFNQFHILIEWDLLIDWLSEWVSECLIDLLMKCGNV